MEEVNEYWVEIPNLKGYYYASNLGRIKSVNRFVSTGTGMREVTERILKPIKTSTGYMVVNLTTPKRKQHIVHRLVALAFFGESDLFVNHIDFDKANNRLSNLELVTQKDNIIHSIIGGRNGQMLLHVQTGIFYSTYKEAASAYGYGYKHFYKMMSKNKNTDFIKVYNNKRNIPSQTGKVYKVSCPENQVNLHK